MRQQILTVTCDQCGVQIQAEMLNVNAYGPIVATRFMDDTLARHGWTLQRRGLRQSDFCERCSGKNLDKSTPIRDNPRNPTSDT